AGGAFAPGRLDQRLGRNAPFAMKLPRHGKRQPALAGEDVGGALARAEQTAEIGLAAPAAFHAVADGVDRIGRIDRPASPFVILDDEGEKIEAIRLRRALLRRALEIPLDLVKRRFVV